MELERERRDNREGGRVLQTEIENKGNREIERRERERERERVAGWKRKREEGRGN